LPLKDSRFGGLFVEATEGESRVLHVRSVAELQVVHDPEKLDESDWSRFVQDNDYGNIFQTPGMYKVYLNTERYEPVFTALLDENENIIALMLGVKISERGRLAGMFSNRIVVYGGPLVTNQGDCSVLHEKILRAHNTEAKKKAIFTEIRNLSVRPELQSVCESINYTYEDHLNIHIDLSVGLEKLRESLHKNRRRGLRKAIKFGLEDFEIKSDTLDALFSIVLHTYERIRVPMPPKSLFESIIEILQKQGHARVIGVKFEDTLVGVGVYLTYNDVIYLWYNTDNRDYAKYGVGEYVLWSAIEWAEENGFKIFDFGGAGRRGQKYGVRDFKLTFGGSLVELGRLICIHSRLKAMIAKIGYRVWRAIQQIR
jgi:lipid II:glycine glycyltransferase (peptidoglycan interpeptide bridge formation enzyme)